MHLALLNEAWVSIGTNRLRTFLSMLGIVIGVGSVILMVAIGSGSKESVQKIIDSLGTDLLIVSPGSRYASANARQLQFDTKDVDALSQLPTVYAVAPATYNRQFNVSYGKTSWQTQITGTTADYFPIRNWVFADGRPFSAEELQTSKRVAVIGADIIDKLFVEEAEQGQSVIGRTISVNGSPFTIIGVLQSKGQGLDGRSQDDAVFVPLTTARNRLWGNFQSISIIQLIYVQATSREDMDMATEDIAITIRERHKLSQTDTDNFTIRNMTAIMQVATETTQAFSLLLGAIASISLVVGGIGIMNIMLVTVTERTREIGIRKALGATEKQILLQFLMEAVVIAFMGSFMGLLLAVGGGMAAQHWFSINVAFTFASAIAALLMAIVIGVASGIYPAFKAARMQPIEALRTVGA